MTATSRTSRQHQATRTAVVLAAALTLCGCAGSDATDSAEPSVPAPSPVTERAQMQAMTACMQERGWDAEFDPIDNGMVVRGVPDEQREQSMADNDECGAEVGLRTTGPPLSEAQLSELYAHQLATADCLRGLGLTVPPAPSEEVFIATYGSSDGWYPYEATSGSSRSESLEYNAKCPQSPEGW